MAARQRGGSVHEPLLIEAHPLAEIDRTHSQQGRMLGHFQQQDQPRRILGHLRIVGGEPVVPRESSAHAEMSGDEALPRVKKRQHAGKAVHLRRVDAINRATDRVDGEQVELAGGEILLLSGPLGAGNPDIARVPGVGIAGIQNGCRLTRVDASICLGRIHPQGLRRCLCSNSHVRPPFVDEATICRRQAACQVPF